MSPLRAILVALLVVSVVHCTLFRKVEAPPTPLCKHAIPTSDNLYSIRLNKPIYYTYHPSLDVRPISNAMHTINTYLGKQVLNLAHSSLANDYLGSHISTERLYPTVQAHNQLAFTQKGVLLTSVIIVNNTLEDTDLESVYLHEFLHTLGLDHVKPDDLNEVMNWALAKEQLRRELTPKAKQTLDCLYGVKK